MAKVLYFDANLKGKAFDVLKENANGTVDIGTGSTVVVKSCVLTEDPKHGHAVRCLAPVLTDSPKPEDGEQKPEPKPRASSAK